MSEWQPARLISIHQFSENEEYHDLETLKEFQRKIVFIRPYVPREQWTLESLRKELDCPDGTRFYEIRADCLDGYVNYVCEHEVLTD